MANNVRGMGDLDDGGHDGPIPQTRVQAQRGFFGRFPIVTMLVVIVELILGITFLVLSEYQGVLCSFPQGILRGEVWRFVTPSLFSVSPFQLIFDILFWIMISNDLERMVGSFPFSLLLLWFTFLTYLLNWPLSGVFEWAGATTMFSTLCSAGLFPLILTVMLAQIRVRASKWVGCCMIFPMPAFLFPFLIIGFSMLISWSYRIVILMGSAIVVGFLFWSGLFRFLMPPTKCWKKAETCGGKEPKCWMKIMNWPHFWRVQDAPEDGGRHFTLKMGQGPEPFTCFCNRATMMMGGPGQGPEYQDEAGRGAQGGWPNDEPQRAQPRAPAGDTRGRDELEVRRTPAGRSTGSKKDDGFTGRGHIA